LRAAFRAEFCRAGIAVAACGASARQRCAAFRAELCRLRHACIAARAIHLCIQDDRGPYAGCNTHAPISSDPFDVYRRRLCLKRRELIHGNAYVASRRESEQSDRRQNKPEPICQGRAMPLTGGDGNALTSAGLVQDPVETLRRTQRRLTPRLRKPWSTLASGRRLCRANSNQSEQLRSDLGILGGHYAGLSPALFRYRDVRSFRAACDLRITWPHGLRARQRHCDKPGREDRAHDGICFEPSIECALILRGQPPIVQSCAAFFHVTRSVW